MNVWVEISHDYRKTCPKCGCLIFFEQYGETLPDKALDFLVLKAHLENYYHSFLSHQKFDDKEVKINVEIVHPPCSQFI